jgi:hypothetical protein
MVSRLKEDWMNESQLFGGIAGAMQFLVALYALRLNRRYGTSRVGWSLFGAFALLALLHLVQCVTPGRATSTVSIEVNATYVLISFLLLIGMLHLESMLKERLHMEQVELQLRADLEIEVKSKTAHLNRAIEELVQEMDATKRMSEIIKSSDTTFTQRFPSFKKGEDTEFISRVLGWEWIAHF